MQAYGDQSGIFKGVTLRGASLMHATARAELRFWRLFCCLQDDGLDAGQGEL